MAKFYPKRGKEAFPVGCPACGDDLDEHLPADEENLAYWRFNCDCELILNDSGILCVEEACPEAMTMAMDSVVYVDEVD